MKAYGLTDTGKIRNQNEDSIFFTTESVGTLPNVFIVSDGMGGHLAGEVASQKSIKYFCEFVRAKAYATGELLDFIVSAAVYANEKVFEMSMRDPSLRGMGTTFSVCVVSGTKLYIAHIGDSRVYFVSGSRIIQLTNDHSYVSELVRAGRLSEADARNHPRKNELTRVLGADAAAEVDGIVYELESDGFLLLCSDGLSNMLTDDEIHKIIGKTDSVEIKIRCLISAANDYGGYDNISDVLADLRR